MNNMRNIIVIPDSFKGSMSSEEVAAIISEEITEASAGAINIRQLPIADGGEGSVDCILKSLTGEKVYVSVKSPENKDIDAYYGIVKRNDKRTAVIEIAQSSGITRQTSYNAKDATTFGFGQLILDALDRECRDFLLCLGGSATTDCGLGMASALGTVFRDLNGNDFIPTGGTLRDVNEIDLSHFDGRIKESTFTVMCDVDNPLYGDNGAAYVYGPQKGASPEDVIKMDAGLKHVSGVYNALTGKNLADNPGAGAAGGAGYGCMAFLNASMKSGIEAMLEIVDFDECVRECDLIITGEGKIDEQSLMGKVLSGIIKHSGGADILAFCGRCDIEERPIDIVEIGRDVELDEAITNGGKYLRKAAKNYFGVRRDWFNGDA